MDAAALHVDDLDPDEPDPDVALIEDEAPTPVRRRLVTQAHHRQVPTPSVEGPSWWVTAPRETFTAQATERAPAMSRSKQASFVRGITVGE